MRILIFYLVELTSHQTGMQKEKVEKGVLKDFHKIENMTEKWMMVGENNKGRGVLMFLL